jgi:hypothetical protein
MESWKVRFIKGSCTFSPSSHTLPNEEAARLVADDMIERVDEIEFRIEIESPSGEIEILEGGMED